jgi:hypothetical protein
MNTMIKTALSFRLCPRCGNPLELAARKCLCGWVNPRPQKAPVTQPHTSTYDIEIYPSRRVTKVVMIKSVLDEAMILKFKAGGHPKKAIRIEKKFAGKVNVGKVKPHGANRKKGWRCASAHQKSS